MELQTIADQLSELKYRAQKINYKNNLPRLPKKPTTSTMSGFHKRLSNWLNILTHMEKERMHGTISSEPNLLEKYILS